MPLLEPAELNVFGRIISSGQFIEIYLAGVNSWNYTCRVRIVECCTCIKGWVLFPLSLGNMKSQALDSEMSCC